MDDDELVEARKQIYAIAQRLVRNQVDADDVTQEAMILLLKNKRPIRNHKAFYWLMAKYGASIVFRQKGRDDDSVDRLLLDKDGEGREHHLGRPLVAIMEDPEGAALVRELLDIIVTGLTRLSKRRRAAILAKALGHDCERCAKQFGTTARQLTADARYGRQRLSRLVTAAYAA